jgi:hypothetical protein
MVGTLKNFNFEETFDVGLTIVAGGFEDRTLTFGNNLRKDKFHTEKILILHYISQLEANEGNYSKLKDALQNKLSQFPNDIHVSSDSRIKSCIEIKNKIIEASSNLTNRNVIIDISGMAHLWALTAIHACRRLNLKISIIYTEAKYYFPMKQEKEELLTAWHNRDRDTSGKYLQSSYLKSVDIVPEFDGNLRTGKPTCLIIFAGYEPNRIDGLIDKYAPSRIIVIYGKSPHQELEWRTQLSKELHKDILSKWGKREFEVSTMDLKEIISLLEHEYSVIQNEYDVIVSPHCSKLQGLATYLFWLRHPEVQLVFTTPGKFNPDHYSKGNKGTFIYELIDV